MEFFKTLLWTVFNWSTSFIYFFIDLIDKIFFADEGNGVFIFYGLYLITLISMGVLTVRFSLKKKLRTSNYFLIIFLLMLGYLIMLLGQIGNKGFK